MEELAWAGWLSEGESLAWWGWFYDSVIWMYNGSSGEGARIGSEDVAEWMFS